MNFREIINSSPNIKKLTIHQQRSSPDDFAESLNVDPSPFPNDFFSILLDGPPQSGKSMLASNLISRVYPKAFNLIFFICPNDSYESSWKGSRVEPMIDKVYPECTPEALDEIDQITREEWEAYRENEESLGKSGNDFATLIVFDDCLHDFKKSKKTELRLGQTIKNRRQIHQCLMFLVQDCKSVPRQCRKNMSSVVMFSKCGIAERNDLNRDFIGLSQPMFNSLCETALVNPYDFLLINKSAAQDKRFARNFNYLVPVEKDKPVRKVL